MQSLKRLGWKFPAMGSLAESPFGVSPQLECRLTPPGGRVISLKSPFLFRRIPWKNLSKETATNLCAAVRQLGSAIAVPISMMEQLPAAATPLRIAQIWSDHSPDLAELEMSDLIELNFCSAKFAQAEENKQYAGAESVVSWPIDVLDTNSLVHRVAMLREVTEHKIPIGFAIPAGNVQADVALALACQVDFVVLTWSPSLFDDKAGSSSTISVADALSEVRLAKSNYSANGGGDELKVIIDAPLGSVEDFPKLFALGAHAWCGQSAIEALLRQPQAPQPNIGYSGMLSSYSASKPATSIQPQLLERLQTYVKSLEYVVARAGKVRPSELANNLLCTIDA